MSKHASHRSSFLTAVFVFLCTALWIPVAPAHADEYQDAIAQAFPRFQILSRSEFDPEIQETVKTNPALVTGLFNDDKREDFAAVIRDRAKQAAKQGVREYYLGKVVVCHGLGKRQYQCQVLTELPIFLPYATYLHRVEPGKVGCPNEEGTVTHVTVERDAIGYVIVHSNGAGVYIYKPDGTYFNCAGE